MLLSVSLLEVYIPENQVSQRLLAADTVCIIVIGNDCDVSPLAFSVVNTVAGRAVDEL